MSKMFEHVSTYVLPHVKRHFPDPGPDCDSPFQPLADLINEIPAWGLVVMAVTAIAGLIIMASVEYTLNHVVMTLAMVESPQTTVFVRDNDQKTKDGQSVYVDSDVLVLNQIPITAKIRTTIRHLTSRAGFTARWRGLSMFMVWQVTGILVAGAFGLGLYYTVGGAPPFWVGPVTAILANVLVARLGLTWTQIVISEPSAKPWYRRIPSRQAWKKIAKPTFITVVAQQLNARLPLVAAWAVGLHLNENNSDEVNAGVTLTQIALVIAVALVTFIGITLPAKVALTRVQASMLPEEHESIVPFDRTFGGVVEPEIVGGSGKLGYVDAWATFDRAARIRILKLYVKTYAVSIGLNFLIAATLIAQFITFVGPSNISRIMNGAAGNDAGSDTVHIMASPEVLERVNRHNEHILHFD